MLKAISALFAVVMVAVLTVGTIVGAAYLGLKMTQYFNPKYEAVRRETFKESQAYNDGMLRDLQNLQIAYTKADGAGKEIIRSVALQRFAVYDPDRLPADLRAFYFQLKTGN